MSVDYSVDGVVAVVTLRNPPINALGLSTRSRFFAVLERAAADDAVKAIVIIGAGKLFCGGADIKEFDFPTALAEPTLHTLINTIERSSKPVVAAIHSACMGGGLELSLGCHYRIAAPGAQIALPEVKLGLLPGAGGTQRLPRAVGVELALKMIISGAPESSETLFKAGLFNELVAGDLLQGALAFATGIAAVRPLPSISRVALEPVACHAFLHASRPAVAAAAGPFPAPLKCLDAIAAAVTLPIEAGLMVEHELFMELVQTTQSKALRHAFFAERAAAKIDVPAATPPRPIASAAVVGGGTMGTGIAMSFANAGMPVHLLEISQQALEKALAAIRRSYESARQKGKLSPEKFERRIALIVGTLSYQDIADADIVVEAVFEDMQIKMAVFKQLDEVMKAGAIMASNTSTLDINRIAASISRAKDVIGAHFFSPAQVMRLLEVVRGAATADDVLAGTMALAKKLGKVGVVSGVCDGFIGNRMVEQYGRQACFLLEEGCLPQQVDQAIENFGFAMGPFRMSDLAGNDIGWHIRKRRRAQDPAFNHSGIPDLLCEMERFGQKSGRGWYDYRADDRTALPAPEVEDMIVRHSTELGLLRRTIGDEEIVERLVYCLVNEAALILEEGIAARASDIDMVYLTGYGFPLFRGGPMFYADTVGLRNVVAALEKYARGVRPGGCKPAPLLIRLAAQGKTFTQD